MITVTTDEICAAIKDIFDDTRAIAEPAGAIGVAGLKKYAERTGITGAHLLTVSEAVRLSEAAGVPAADVLAVVNAASGRSAVSEVNYPRWVLNGAFDSGFTMGLMRKDVRLAAALVAETGVDLPVSDLVARIWADSAARLADSEDFNRIVQDELKA